MHGGMGMTDELKVGHYFKRLTMIDTIIRQCRSSPGPLRGVQNTRPDETTVGDQTMIDAKRLCYDLSGNRGRRDRREPRHWARDRGMSGQRGR